MRYRVIIEGIEVTSGADFPKGRNANIEMCKLIVELASEKIFAVYLRGGDVISNVAGHCEAVFDIQSGNEMTFLSLINDRKLNPHIDGVSYSWEEITND